MLDNPDGYEDIRRSEEQVLSGMIKIVVGIGLVVVGMMLGFRVVLTVIDAYVASGGN